MGNGRKKGRLAPFRIGMTPYLDHLRILGFPEKESKVYLACLCIGPASAKQISEKAGVKRPTVYVSLQTLRNKGLICTAKNGKKVCFVAQHPNNIIIILEEQKKAAELKLRLFKELLPDLSFLVQKQ